MTNSDVENAPSKSTPQVSPGGAQPPLLVADESLDETPTQRKGSVLKRLRGCLLYGIALPAVLLVLVIAVEWLRYPDVARLATEPPQTSAFMKRAARAGPVAWTWVPDRRIAPALRKAVVAAEDISFFSHDGFDRDEIEKAIKEARDGGRVRGASTITQQLAKNLWLSPSRNPLRKIKEILLARSLEKHLSKRRILEIYVNVVEFGPQTYGAEAAARKYFGKSAAALSAGDAAALAASLPSSKWHPGATSHAYQNHVRRIRGRMSEAGWLDGLVR